MLNFLDIGIMTPKEQTRMNKGISKKKAPKDTTLSSEKELSFLSRIEVEFFTSLSEEKHSPRTIRNKEKELE